MSLYKKKENLSKNPAKGNCKQKQERIELRSNVQEKAE